MAVRPWIVPDELWELIAPLLSAHPRRLRYPGRKRLADRPALCGILFVLHTGIAWRRLPPELGCGSGITCWRRLDEWRRAGVWSSCTPCCWRACAPPARSTSRGRAPTPATCRPKRGRRDGAEPG